jgi:beta-phosphoglucomutase-like phosphatase (HAD superfamily)
MSSSANGTAPASVHAVDSPFKLKAILFDVDGTMADTDVFHRRVYKDLLKPFGIECTDEFYNQHISGKDNVSLHKQLVPHLSKEDGTKLFEGTGTQRQEHCCRVDCCGCCQFTHGLVRCVCLLQTRRLGSASCPLRSWSRCPAC